MRSLVPGCLARCPHGTPLWARINSRANVEYGREPMGMVEVGSTLLLIDSASIDYVLILWQGQLGYAAVANLEALP